MRFSHLHNHTQFSLLDGATSIPKLFAKAAKDNMPAVAITDHGNMFGVFEFVDEAWKNKKVVGKTPEGKEIYEPVVKPVVGCEFYLVADRHKRQFSKDDKDIRYHQLLLAKNEIGYRNLVKLCSLGYIEGLYGKYPRIDKELIAKHHEGLIATTCCLGAEVPRTILRKGEEAGEAVFKWWHNLFGEDYYVELQRHDIGDQRKVNDVLVRFAQKYNVPIIASNDSHYLEQVDANAHDILLCINTASKQSEPKWRDLGEDEEIPVKGGRFAFPNDQFYFKTTQEMETLFSDIPEAIENTNAIVDKIVPLKLERDILLPFYKVPDQFNNDQNAYLEFITWEGAKSRYPIITPEIEERISFELGIIKKMGFAGYFLIVMDFINFGKNNNVLVGPGRGSAAGSVVAYCVGITNIDPIKYKLLFERFLNPDRKSMPDIDTDFDDAGRQRVIDYVVEKYGKSQVAQIVTYGTMAARSSIKDVARALDLPLNESNILTKMVPERPGMSLKNIFNWPVNKEGKPEAKDDLKPDDLNAIAGMQAIHKEDSLQGRVFREAEKLEGSVRNTGIHAAGIIIAPEDITNLLPVCMTKDVDAFITQFEGNVIERAGVIKMDILGLKTLTEINDAIKLIEKNYGITIDIDNIPLDDPKTFALFQAGETTGTFQFESPGMQKYLIGMKPDKFEDLIAINALYRPGPMAYIPEYIKRKHGQAPITYDIEAMSEHLSDTYGITVYQEQVMLLSQSLGAFSKGDADNLRKAMGKKQIDVLNKMKSKFLEGATKNGHPQAKLEKIWGDWEEFAKYAFNKSHATCYAYVAYQTAYLKAHYPAEYMAAVLNNKGNIEDIKFYMEECKRMKIKVLGPDVNESLKGFSVPNKNIRFGLNAIKGIGEAAVDDIIADREKNGAYLSVYDFFKRVNQKSINKKTIENLTLAGAFDSFNSFHRAQYFYVSPTDQQSGIERLVKYGAQVQADSNDGGMSLFMDAQMPEVKPPQLPECPKWQLDDMLEKEKEVVGLYLTAHPLDAYKFEMENFGFLPVTSVPTTKERSIKVAGILSDVKVFTTKSGKEACHFTLNDYSGCYKFTLWDKEYAKYYSLINERGKIAIYGSNEPKRFIADEYELVVSRIIKLDDLKNTLTKKITLYLNIEKITPLLVDFLKNTLYGSKGNIDISFEIVKDNSPARVSLKMPNHKISLTQPLIEYLNNTNEVQYMLEANHSVG